MKVPDYISHYHYADKEPFLSLSELKEEERSKILTELNRRYKNGESLREFPEWYMEQRQEAEEKLLKMFLEAGGRPERKVPHYFTLGDSPLFESIYQENCKKVSFHVSHFDRSVICFTINDSLWTMAESRIPGFSHQKKWYEGKIYTYEEVCKILLELELDVNDHESLKKHRLNYVEALVYTDKVKDLPLI